MRLIHVVGARPNFMKVAPVWRALAPRNVFHQLLVHTGQHYDVNMSDIFFQELALPPPDYYLGVGSGTHAQQTAAVMVAFERVVQEAKPELVLVYGDVNSTVAAALVCAKLQVPLAHVEAGLRSFDRAMPEEVNRVLTDQLADFLFTPSADGDENLLREGIAPEKIHRVGNVMIDTLVRLLPVSQRSDILRRVSLQPRHYAVLTLHRPQNVDDENIFRRLLHLLLELSAELPIVFPVHPRTRRIVDSLYLDSRWANLRLMRPLGYVDFLALMRQARLVFTDSGGIQEETTFLGIPCITLRTNTERPVTVELGTNRLVGHDRQQLVEAFYATLNGCGTQRSCSIPLWDGRAGERIALTLSTLAG